MRGARLHNGADNDLQQTAAHGIDHDGDQQPRKGRGQHLRQNGQQHEPGDGHGVRQHRRGPVADLIHKLHRGQVHQQLQAEVQRHQQGDLGKRNAILALKRQKQQRHKVIDDGLNDITDKTSHLRFFIVLFRRLHGALHSFITRIFDLLAQRPAQTGQLSGNQVQHVLLF